MSHLVSLLPEIAILSFTITDVQRTEIVKWAFRMLSGWASQQQPHSQRKLLLKQQNPKRKKQTDKQKREEYHEPQQPVCLVANLVFINIMALVG